MKKKIIAGTAISISVIAILLSTLFMQTTPSYAAYVRSLPTKNTEVTPKGTPTPIPGVMITGDYLRIGINQGGTFGVGNGSDPGTGFPYPIGPQDESLAWAWWGEGYIFAYKTDDNPTGVWVDHIAYWQPGLGWKPPAACNIEPVRFSRIVDDSNFAHYVAQVQTADKALTIKFHFMFAKHMKYVTLYTEIKLEVSVKDLIYKRFIDWDIHNVVFNDWSTDSHSADATHYNEELRMRYVFTTSGETVSNWNKYVPYAEVYGWDDYMSRPPFETIQSHATPITYYDGAAMITFDLGNGVPRYAGVTLQTTVYYQAGENFLPLY